MWANTTAVRYSNYGDWASSDLVNWWVLASCSPDNCLLFVFNVIQLPAVSTEALLKYHRNESWNFSYFISSGLKTWNKNKFYYWKERWMTRQTFWLDLLSNQVGWAWLLIDLRYSFPAKSIIFHWATSTTNPNIKTVGDPCDANIDFAPNLPSI